MAPKIGCIILLVLSLGFLLAPAAWAEGEAFFLLLEPEELRSAMSAVGTTAAPPSPSPAPPVLTPTDLSAAAAVLMDWTTGRVLFAKNEHRQRAPASTTKIVTALVVLDRNLHDHDLREQVKVSVQAARTEGSSMDLKPGDVFTLEDLLWGLLLVSGNDAAVAIAEYIGGSEQGFAELMNRKVWELGAWNSRFVNPHGLTEPGHYSTAYDLALVTRYALRDPLFAQMVSTVSKTVHEQRTGREVYLYNTNRLLGSYPGAEGVKTGTTDAAGRCLVAAGRQDGWRLIGVVLRSGDRFGEAVRLLEYGFGTYRLRRFVYEGDPVVTVPVRRGRSRFVSLAAGEALDYVGKPDEVSRLKLRVEAPARLQAPVYGGQPEGRATLLLDGQEVGSTELVVAETVAARTLGMALAGALRAFFTVELPPVWP